MTVKLHELLVRLAIAGRRLHDDPANPKRLVTFWNLIEQLEEHNELPRD